MKIILYLLFIFSLTACQYEGDKRLVYALQTAEGNPVCKYTLDRAIYGIHVDEKTNRIIATNVNSDNPIVEFKI